ncbi:FecR domain-containing protein [Sphingomonas sp. H39-1-10]|uniref:FecR family protein n=1 Tax=Sphingomonas pollutisoli TaxID=3030829 RepID=UPI0023B8F94E|nr:FecR domain-containing protein [Sphingomonas pollutisoli]MDF0490300.1 FecR domain-containing protein [Sphingomonas pollutisoli]
MTEGQDSSYGVDARSLANREATDWLILLQEEPEDAILRARFELWRAGSALNAAVWEDTQCVSDRIVAIPAAHADRWRGFSRAGDAQHVVSLGQAQQRKRGIWPLLVRHRAVGAMSAIAAIALAIMAGPDMLLRLQADAVSETGEVETLHLADGSMVAMAPRSAVAIDVKDGHRQVRLLRGSAYFDIVHDPAHPFRVLSAGTVTTVLGTAFEVHQGTDTENISVSVSRGLVGVACAGQSRQIGKLSVGDAVDVACNDGARAVRRRVEPGRIATWRKGQIVVSDRPVRDVIDALRPWHRGFIIARGSKLDTDRVTGVYDARQPERALRGLSTAHTVSVRSLTPWVTIVTAD